MRKHNQTTMSQQRSGMKKISEGKINTVVQTFIGVTWLKVLLFSFPERYPPILPLTDSQTLIPIYLSLS